MKNADLFSMKNAIQSVKEKGSNKFKLPLILNEMKIDEHLKALEELRKPSEKFQEYEQKRRELILNHAELDEGGNIKLYSEAKGQGDRLYDYGIPNIVKDEKEFEEKNKALQEEFKEVFEKQKKAAAEFESTLKEDANIELNKIPFGEFPEVSYEEMKVLMPLIDE
jgi:seryl-tRNA synthetase